MPYGGMAMLASFITDNFCNFEMLNFEPFKSCTNSNPNAMAAGTASIRPRESNGVHCITERWIREHLNLQKDSLDDVRSISLPGSYYEKITHLGRSMVGFIRLKHLDLSRNALESLEGLDHLKHLETLNIYYNNIGTLTELFRLRHNKKLKDLDVRLNPVTKNEPDYRLFMVHMLVSLRKLDDRSVRDSERRAALLHFNSDQAHLFERSSESRTPQVEPPQQEPRKHLSARKKLVESLAPSKNCLDNDTDELLDLISRRDHRHPQLNAHSPQLNAHSPPPTPPHHHTLYEEAQEDSRGSSHFTQTPIPRTGYTVDHERESLSSVKLKDHHSDRVAAALEDLLGFMQWFIDGDLGPLQMDSEFKEKFGDWLRAHLPPPSTSSHLHNAHSTPSHLHTPPSTQRAEEQIQKLEEDIRSLQQKLETTISTSQHKDTEIAQLKTQLEQSESETNMLTQQLEEARAKLSDQLSHHTRAEEELQQQLHQTARDSASLQERLHSLQQENVSLRTTLDQTPPTGDTDTFKQKIREVESERNTLRLKLEHAMQRQKQEAETSVQLNELAVMLQESHRSLVATNSHLLQELEETKQRHSQEVTQMNLNYENLRKTIDTYTSI